MLATPFLPLSGFLAAPRHSRSAALADAVAGALTALLGADASDPAMGIRSPHMAAPLGSSREDLAARPLPTLLTRP